jgi:hypothetical protein
MSETVEAALNCHSRFLDLPTSISAGIAQVP